MKNYLYDIKKELWDRVSFFSLISIFSLLLVAYIIDHSLPVKIAIIQWFSFLALKVLVMETKTKIVDYLFLPLYYCFYIEMKFYSYIFDSLVKFYKALYRMTRRIGLTD